MNILFERTSKILALASFTLLFGVGGSVLSKSETVMPATTWGRYKGFNFGCIRFDQPFDRCKTEMVVDANGVTIKRSIDGLMFDVVYDSQWLISKGEARGLPRVYEPGLQSFGLRTERNGKDTQMWLDFNKQRPDDPPSIYVFDDVRVEPTGMFLTDGAEADDLLKQHYDSIKDAFTESHRHEHDVISDDYEVIAPLDLHAVTHIMRSGSRQEKLEAAVHAAKTIEVASSATEVDNAFRVLKLALRDSDKVVQEHAIRPFTLYAHSPLGIQIIVSSIKNVGTTYNNLSRAAISEMVQLNAMLLYDAYLYLHRDALLRSKFGTTDLADIHKRTGGRIAADQIRLLYLANDKFLAHNKFTTEHYMRLYKSLQLVVFFPKLFDKADVIKAQQVLEETADPFGSCIGALQ